MTGGRGVGEVVESPPSKGVWELPPEGDEGGFPDRIPLRGLCSQNELGLT